jgi:hypothetical protein
MHNKTTKSLVSTQRILIYFVMLPQLIAKYVFGMDDFLYVDDKNNANSIIKDITSASDLSFETSTKPRIIEFYSPYCVRPWMCNLWYNLWKTSSNFLPNSMSFFYTGDIVLFRVIAFNSKRNIFKLRKKPTNASKGMKLNFMRYHVPGLKIYASSIRLNFIHPCMLYRGVLR